MPNDSLTSLFREGIISSLDFHFAGFMARLAGNDAPELTLAAALVSSFTGEGHICLDLGAVEGKPLTSGTGNDGGVLCPPLRHWRNLLRDSRVVGRPGEYKPLILDHRNRLYLFRYWEYENKLAAGIKQRVATGIEGIDTALLGDGVARLFPVSEDREPDWQKVAAMTALLKRFCVISGGPGTGKTTVVTKIIALLLEQTGGGTLRIALAAPTGKAAARLQEAIKSTKNELHCSEATRQAIPEEASTIHRLLETIPFSPYFRHDAAHPLPVDVVVVDEVSMVSLPLMSKLSDAIPLHARLILLGDRDQLASVEAGAVLGDICDTGREHGSSRQFREALKHLIGNEVTLTHCDERDPGLQDCMVQLHRSYRFGKESGIGQVSRAIREGDSSRAFTILKEGNRDDITWSPLPPPHALPQALRETIVHGFGPYLRTKDYDETLHLFERFRILCAIREGPYGVGLLNALAEQILKRENLIAPEARWYAGRPIMITRNDYQLRLFNGDVGIILPAPEGGKELRAYFSAPEGTVRSFPIIRLPAHETVYAMTVHKSQGSEFEQALFVLPDRVLPVVTRELIYTGITRVRRRITLWGLEHVFHAAVSRRIERTSGLREALWGEDCR